MTTVFTPTYNPRHAEVAEWQTRTFEGRVGKPVRVQVPASAPSLCEGIAQVLIRLDDSLPHPSFMQSSRLITSSGFVGSHLVFPAQFVVLPDTYLIPIRGGSRQAGWLIRALLPQPLIWRAVVLSSPVTRPHVSTGVMEKLSLFFLRSE